MARNETASKAIYSQNLGVTWSRTNRTIKAHSTVQMNQPITSRTENETRANRKNVRKTHSMLGFEWPAQETRSCVLPAGRRGTSSPLLDLLRSLVALEDLGAYVLYGQPYALTKLHLHDPF